MAGVKLIARFLGVLLVIDQNRARSLVHDLRCFVQIEKVSKERQMMTGCDDQIGVDLAGQFRDFYGRVSD